MILIRVLLAALLCCSGAAYAASDGFVPKLDGLDAVPRLATNGATLGKAVASTAPRKGEPLQYGVSAALPSTLADGQWDTIDTGTSRWRLRLTSAGAKNLSVEFAHVQLPEGARLYIYDAAGLLAQGPYSAASASADGTLWTAMVQGSDAVIELRVPTDQRDAVGLATTVVMHGFLDFADVMSGSNAKSLSNASAGSCEINVACSPGDNWRSEIRSVGTYTITNADGTGTVCSGQLINDVPQDLTPYFITANHCGVNSAAVAASLVVYWNYQASSCSGSSGSLGQSQSGSTLIAGDVGSDFTLVRLLQSPNSSYSLYFAGFDASGTGATSGVGIHHPEGDIKKISSFNGAVVQDQLELTGTGTARMIQAWRVGWLSGVTEQGSSGSGLWNQNRQLIGVLSGGNSSCSNPTGNDYYGRLDVAWTASSSASGQLKASLDPNNTGRQSVAGINANGAAGATGTVPAPTAYSGVSSGSASSPTGGGGGGAFAPVWLIGLALFARRRSRR